MLAWIQYKGNAKGKKKQIARYIIYVLCVHAYCIKKNSILLLNKNQSFTHQERSIGSTGPKLPKRLNIDRTVKRSELLFWWANEHVVFWLDKNEHCVINSKASHFGSFFTISDNTHHRHSHLFYDHSFRILWDNGFCGLLRLQTSCTKFVFFGTIGENKMATPASNLLRHIRLLIWNCLVEFNETWPEARSQRLISSFFGPIRKQDGRTILWIAEIFFLFLLWNWLMEFD